MEENIFLLAIDILSHLRPLFQDGFPIRCWLECLPSNHYYLVIALSFLLVLSEGLLIPNISTSAILYPYLGLVALKNLI